MEKVKLAFISFIMALYVYFEPVFSALLVVLGMACADMICGMLAASKRGEQITSRRARDTVSKMASYGIAILVSYVIEKEILHGDFPALKMAAISISLMELWSIDENFESINGFSVLKPLIRVMKSKRNGK